MTDQELARKIEASFWMPLPLSKAEREILAMPLPPPLPPRDLAERLLDEFEEAVDSGDFADGDSEKAERLRPFILAALRAYDLSEAERWLEGKT